MCTTIINVLYAYVKNLNKNSNIKEQKKHMNYLPIKILRHLCF